MKVVTIIVMTILAIGMLIFFGWLGYSFYQQRQGPALENTSEALFATKTPKPALKPTLRISPTAIRPGTATVESSISELAKPVPTKNPDIAVTPTADSSLPELVDTCGESGNWNILIIGSDYSEMRGQKGSDLTRILHADFSNKQLVVYAFSRDLWVDTAGIGLTSPEVNASRLGMVFYEGRIRSLQFAELDTIVDGTRATSKMLLNNFSIPTDHYLALDLKHLAEIIDEIGGLQINIPARTTDPYIGMVIEAGQQTLNGSQVVSYARAIPDTDFGRIQRNNLLLDAIHKKLLDPAVMTQIPTLFMQYKKFISTDLSLEQVSNLACLLNQLPDSAITQEGVKPEWTSPGPQGSLLWDRNLVIARLKELGIVP